ncbi:DUF2283 domain-containing protein [Amycolatopsis sp. DG1A-15b]|uniref:DUF2283 domain-containing protein n=1 Tax=Amycolatopsis sp. DG1A-15b TaxID=3052846 RepID=UPI00255B98F9|nr:DUF2283 domain-containing protein [Amycolatopsis sp. DG1A-15b]WIX90693.1 DUF2283 domain-containing protein [Amycolatopsis sp. DG1A-15b]
MAEIDVTYDETVDAAYLRLLEPGIPLVAARTYPCDPAAVCGMINLDLDEQGRLVGIEVLGARNKLPPSVLDAARPI